MAEPLAGQIMRKVKQAADLYHRLMLVIAPAGAGKTTALLDIQNRTGAPLVNVNLELSRRMLDLTDRQRALQLPRLLRDLVSKSEGEMILLDNIEILFDVGLKQDPLRLLQGLSRNKTSGPCRRSSTRTSSMPWTRCFPGSRRFRSRSQICARRCSPAAHRQHRRR